MPEDAAERLHVMFGIFVSPPWREMARRNTNLGADSPRWRLSPTSVF